MSSPVSNVKILKKLLDVRKKVEYMQKEGHNSSQGYNFLAESQITAQFKKLLDEAGIVFHYSSSIYAIQDSPKKTQLVTSVFVRYQFIDVDTGEYLEGEAVGQGADPGDKGVYKAITGAIKYIFMKTFLIPTGDDPENDTREEKKDTRKRAARESASYGTSYGTSGEEKSPTKRNDVPFEGGGQDAEED